MKSLALIVNTETDEVVWNAVADDKVAEDLLDETSKKYRTKMKQDATDLEDDLWVEDDRYDYIVVSLDEGEIAESVFKSMGWKVRK